MAKITLYHDQSAAATCVPNIFIDQYMTRANGEYVKIYLYLLRCFAQPSADFSLSGLADHFLKRTAEFIETCCGRRGEIKCCIGHSNFLSLYVV